MADDYGLLNQAAEQDHSSEIPDAFYNNVGKLPDALKAKLSLHDLRCIYEFMVQPVIWVVMDNMASGTTALPEQPPLPYPEYKDELRDLKYLNDMLKHRGDKIEYLNAEIVKYRTALNQIAWPAHFKSEMDNTGVFSPSLIAQNALSIGKKP